MIMDRDWPPEPRRPERPQSASIRSGWDTAAGSMFVIAPMAGGITWALAGDATLGMVLWLGGWILAVLISAVGGHLRRAR